MEFEIHMHNLEYWFGIERDKTKYTDLGKTIFNDSHAFYDENGNVSLEGLMSILMKCLYIIHQPFSAFYDLLIERKF